MATTATPAKKPAAKSAATALPADIFGVEVKSTELLKLAYNAYLAEARSAQARTKTRGLISGGGKKPWKQKGTGRARTGSIRNPIWRGGGITFGPTGNENYSLTMSTKQRRQALRQALSLANKAGQITQVASFAVKEGKTKEAVAMLSAHKAIRGALIITGAKTPELIRSTNNLPGVNVVSATHVAAFNVLNAHHVLIDASGLEQLNTRLGKEATK